MSKSSPSQVRRSQPQIPAPIVFAIINRGFAAGQAKVEELMRQETNSNDREFASQVTALLAVAAELEVPVRVLRKPKSDDEGYALETGVNACIRMLRAMDDREQFLRNASMLVKVKMVRRDEIKKLVEFHLKDLTDREAWRATASQFVEAKVLGTKHATELAKPFLDSIEGDDELLLSETLRFCNAGLIPSARYVALSTEISERRDLERKSA